MRQLNCECHDAQASLRKLSWFLLYRPVKPEQLSKDGSILLLAIFDHDTFGSNDFAGLCAIPCTSTPVEGTEPKIEHINLFQYQKTEAYEELELRHSDVKAQDFLKHMKKFVFEGEK